MVQTFNDNLSNLLKNDSRLLDKETGELIRSEIINKALSIDKELIGALLSDKEVKEKFFTEIKGHWIFEINKFVDYIQDKNFLSDSYTNFKNKIGLNIDGKFLNERNEVALVWPFKDCVLEGGMTQEDEKRNEIFFNEILAQDEIDRLLDPKAFTNFKRFTVNGEEKVTDFKRDPDGTINENLIIKGNNLLALNSLKKEFQGKVKLIYIDPPYNKDGSNFYNDNFKHSTWLTFMKNRLEIAKYLLTEDGSILISCDDKENAYLKVLCDEIFTRDNFVANFVWKSRSGGGNDAINVAIDHEYILCYAKDVTRIKFKKLPYSEHLLSLYNQKDEYFEERGPYRRMLLMAKNIRYSKSLTYPIKAPDGSFIRPPDDGQCIWRWSLDKFEKANKEGFIEFIEDTEGWKIYTKQYLNVDYDGNPIERGVLIRSVLDTVDGREGSKILKKLFGEKVFDNPKAIELMIDFIRVTTEKHDAILDFFAGSGTTAHATLALNKEDGGHRNFILIEQMNYSDSVTSERIRKILIMI